MANTRKLLKEKVPEAVKNNISMSATLDQLGLKKTGGNYSTLKGIIRDLTLDVSHWKGQGQLRGKNHSWSKGFDLKDILIKNSTYSNTVNLKNKLFKANLLENKCSECGQLPEWNGKPLTLQIDHINGIRDDNTLSNLRILCSHCHSQNETYCGKRFKLPDNLCACGQKIGRRSKSCGHCRYKFY